MHIEKENTLRAAIKSGINLFVGAGFSCLAENSAGLDLPVGDMLKSELCKYFNLQSCACLELSKVCTIIEQRDPAAFRLFLKQRFTVERYDERYESITKLNVKSIFTTNIDDLVHGIFGNSDSKYISDITKRGPVHGDRSCVDYIPLHGSIANEDDKLFFSTLDLASSFSLDEDKWHFFKQKIRDTPTIFWGYGLNDSGVLEALNIPARNGKTHKPKWINLRQADEASIEYFKALGFNIILADTDELLDYFSDKDLLVEQINRRLAPCSKIFPGCCIPDSKSVPVRPLLDFYKGEEPSWYDVFSARLYKISHYFDIIESINSGKDVIVVGVPASGKTTLLMQIAFDYECDCYKIVSDSITKEKATMILNKLGDNRLIAFIDNFANDIDGIFLLTNDERVQVVCFERDYNYEMISHRVDSSKFIFHGISELAEHDITKLFTHIPDNIRKGKRRIPLVEMGVVPSVFEFVESNVVTASLKERFYDVLNQLKRNDATLHSLFLMCCYLHSCGSEVSYDVASSFLGDHVKKYDDVWDYFNSLGKIVVESQSMVAGGDQDYFVPRSTLVSEAVMDIANATSLRDVITKFHSDVSYIKIANFDRFKRRAFDAKLMEKVFPNYLEGKEFYERMFDIDRSPFLLQQAALYLKRKKRYNEAFQAIDKALTMTNSKVVSIRNSHAIILFDANINQDPSDPVVVQTLKMSMDILSQCYMSDKRKIYHALAFGKQAIQFWKIFGNKDAKEYLNKAHGWLESERDNSPWASNVKYLLKDVSKLIATI